MATLTKTWTFTSNLDGWTATPSSPATLAWTSADSGSIAGGVFGRNNGGTSNLSLTISTTYGALGIPSGADITAIQFNVDHKCTTWNVGSYLYFSGLVDSVTQIAQVDYTGTTALANASSGSISVTKTDTDTIALQLLGSARTGNNASASVQLMWDDAELVITYTEVVNEVLGSTTMTGSETTTVSGLVTALGTTTMVGSETTTVVGTIEYYELERKIGVGSYSVLAKFPTSTLAYDDHDITDGTYYYRIRRYLDGQYTDYSNEYSYTVSMQPTVYGATQMSGAENSTVVGTILYIRFGEVAISSIGETSTIGSKAISSTVEITSVGLISLTSNKQSSVDFSIDSIGTTNASGNKQSFTDIDIASIGETSADGFKNSLSNVNVEGVGETLITSTKKVSSNVDVDGVGTIVLLGNKQSLMNVDVVGVGEHNVVGVKQAIYTIEITSVGGGSVSGTKKATVTVDVSSVGGTTINATKDTTVANVDIGGTGNVTITGFNGTSYDFSGDVAIVSTGETSVSGEKKSSSSVDLVGVGETNLNTTRNQSTDIDISAVGSTNVNGTKKITQSVVVSAVGGVVMVTTKSTSGNVSVVGSGTLFIGGGQGYNYFGTVNLVATGQTSIVGVKRGGGSINIASEGNIVLNASKQAVGHVPLSAVGVTSVSSSKQRSTDIDLLASSVLTINGIKTAYGIIDIGALGDMALTYTKVEWGSVFTVIPIRANLYLHKTNEGTLVLKPLGKVLYLDKPIKR